MVLIASTNVYFIAWLFPVVACFMLLRNYAAGAQRDLQRLEAVSRSPIFAQFGETLNGLTTIRAFGAARVHTSAAAPRRRTCAI